MRHNPNTILASRVSPVLRQQVLTAVLMGVPYLEIIAKHHVSRKFISSVRAQAVRDGLLRARAPRSDKGVVRGPKQGETSSVADATVRVFRTAASAPAPAPTPTPVPPLRGELLRRKLTAYQRLAALVEEIGDLLLTEAR